MTQLVRELSNFVFAQMFIYEVCRCRTCRIWDGICVVASISMWQGNGNNVCSPSFPWVSDTHSKHGRCENGFVCVNVFESGVYFCAGRRSGDRIQEIKRRKAVVLRVRLWYDTRGRRVGIGIIR
jgi:hypothetical protein